MSLMALMKGISIMMKPIIRAWTKPNVSLMPLMMPSMSPWISLIQYIIYWKSLRRLSPYRGNPSSQLFYWKRAFFRRPNRWRSVDFVGSSFPLVISFMSILSPSMRNRLTNYSIEHPLRLLSASNRRFMSRSLESLFGVRLLRRALT